MKKLLALVFVAVMVGGAIADDAPGMGVFFSDTDFTADQTNIVVDAPYAPFDAYLVVIDVPLSSVGGYEVGLHLVDAAGDTMGTENYMIMSVGGPNGWTNFGTNTNHLVGYTVPVPLVDGACVLSTINMMMVLLDPLTIEVGPALPSSVGDEGPFPAIADGGDPNNLIACFATGGTTPGGVATINGEGSIATESRSLSSVKALFQ